VKAITQATIIFLSIGTVSGLLILYDYFVNPHLISKEQAIRIALKSVSCNNDTRLSYDAILMHVKNDGFAFTVNEKTLQDKDLIQNKFNSLKENQYVWEVDAGCNNPYLRSDNNGKSHFVDATNGQIIQ
jgi:uncharacterized membrane protein